MTQSISLQDETSASLHEVSSLLSLDVNDFANEILENFMKEQGQQDKVAKARQMFDVLSKKSKFELGDVKWTSESIHDR
jgi:hypothetical protein